MEEDITNESNNSNTGILITLLTIFIGLWYSLLNMILELNSQRLSSYNFDYDWKINFLIGSSYLIFLYILYILYALFFDATIHAPEYFKKEETSKKRDETFKNVVLGWPALLIMLFFLFFYFITHYSFKHYLYFIIIFLGYGFIIYKFFKQYAKKKFFKLENGFFKKIFLIWIPVNIFLFVGYLTMLAVITTDVKVSYEKNVYTPSEKVRFELKPTGIILPKIYQVTYSNKYNVIFNGTNEEFKSVPRYLIIDPKILTSEPENSFIAVTYYYFDTDIDGFKWLNNFGNRIISNVPVYKK